MGTDAERLLVEYLNGAGIGAAAHYDVPADRPVAFVTVLLTGGGHDNIVMEHPRLVADCWGGTRQEALRLALSVRDAVLAMPRRVDNVFGASETSMYRNPDPDTGCARYSVSFELTICE